jgi:ribokinase
VALLILQNEVPEALNLAAARQARSRGVLTLLNAAPARPLPRGMEQAVDVLVVNAVEAEMMGTGPVTDLESAGKAALRLGERFATVIVTAGSRGLAAVTAGGAPFLLAAERVKVVSSHGAGDAFIGALAASLVGGNPLHDACRAASQAAARHVSAT